MKKTKITICDVVPENVDEIQNILYLSSFEVYLLCGFTEDDVHHKFKDLFLEDTLVQRKEHIENLTPNEKYIVAKEGDRLIGLCYVEKNKNTNLLHAMYVLPEYHGNGIGLKLWEEISKFFDPKKNIVLHVFECNTKAINFYLKLGFFDTGERLTDKQHKMKNGKKIQVMEMVKVV